MNPFKAADSFWSAKTTWLGFGIAAAAITRAILKELPWPDAVNQVFAGFALAFVRDAIVKAGEDSARVVARAVKEEKP